MTSPTFYLATRPYVGYNSIIVIIQWRPFLSGTANNQPNPNIIPDPNLSDPDSDDKSPDSISVEQSSSTPLPDFRPIKPEPMEPQAPLKSSIATPQNLRQFLTTQRSGEEPESRESTPKPVYKISSAEPDLPGHIIPGENESLPEEETPSTWKTIWAVTREVGETIILTLIIFLLIQLVIRNFRVVGTSMVSNLHDGQYLIIDKVSYSPFLTDNLNIGGPQRGDVIVFKPPRNPGDDYVKRIIGLPGEKVQIINGQVLINDQPLEEPFHPVPGTYSMPAPVIVPENQVFVLGDNRNNSNDSHNWGPLPVENIVGRAWLSYWPPDQWGTIPRDTPTEEATLWYFLNDLIPSANAQNE